MKISLPFGNGALNVVLPENAEILRPEPHSATTKPVTQDDIETALDKPVGCIPLRGMLRKRKPSNICIVVSDHTRAVPNALLLSPVIRVIESSGIPRHKIKILIASGMHRPTTKDRENRNPRKRNCREFFR